MKYFFSEKNVEDYCSLVEGFNNTYLMNVIDELLPAKKSILELGSGPGIDLKELAKKYDVIGSDNSPIFLNHFRKNNKNIKYMQLNAIDFEIDKKFDLIYSNKVLQHLKPHEFKQSLMQQASHLKNNGLILFTLWKSKFCIEEIGDMDFYTVFYEKDDIVKLIPDNLEVVKYKEYKEIDDNDSFYMILKNAIN